MDRKKKIRVKPVFGYGWRLHGTLIDTPNSFDIAIYSNHSSKERGEIFLGASSGRIGLIKMPYISLWSRAHYDEFTTYTVLIHDFEPEMSEILRSETAPPSIGEGYALIENE
jgi:hypothetical protein